MALIRFTKEGFEENKKVSKRGGEIAGDARKKTIAIYCRLYILNKL